MLSNELQTATRNMTSAIFQQAGLETSSFKFRAARITSVAEAAVAEVTVVRSVELGSLAQESMQFRRFGVEKDLDAVAAEVAGPVLLADWKGENSDDPTLVAVVSPGVEAQGQQQGRDSVLRAV